MIPIVAVSLRPDLPGPCSAIMGFVRSHEPNFDSTLGAPFFLVGIQEPIRDTISNVGSNPLHP